MTQNTRSQYGSSPNSYSQAASGMYSPSKYTMASAYSAPKQSYTQPKSGQGYSSTAAAVAAPSQGYQSAPSNSYSPVAATPQYVSAAPANQYGESSSYQSSAPSGSYSPRPSYPQPASSNSGYGSPANSYSSGGSGSSYGGGYESPFGYQPLEPGHTLLTATNDNYDGQTQLSVASNPPKEPKGYHSSSSYGVQPSYGGQQQSSYNAPSSYQPSMNSNSYNNAPASYQQPSYSASHPQFDDSANYAAQSYQGNYGTRTSNPKSNGAGYMEAY